MEADDSVGNNNNVIDGAQPKIQNVNVDVDYPKEMDVYIEPHPSDWKMPVAIFGAVAILCTAAYLIVSPFMPQPPPKQEMVTYQLGTVQLPADDFNPDEFALYSGNELHDLQRQLQDVIDNYATCESQLPKDKQDKDYVKARADGVPYALTTELSSGTTEHFYVSTPAIETNHAANGN